MAAIDANGDDLLSFDELWAWWANSGRGRAPRLPSISSISPAAPPPHAPAGLAIPTEAPLQPPMGTAAQPPPVAPPKPPPPQPTQAPAAPPAAAVPSTAQGKVAVTTEMASAPQLVTMAVIIPQGVSEGGSFLVRAGASEYHVTVPVGHGPGATLHIDVPVDPDE